MTVQELIGRLREMDPDHQVLVDGYESGCDEPVVYKSVAGRDPEPAGYSGAWIPEGDNFDRGLPPNPEPVVVVGRGLNQ